MPSRLAISSALSPEPRRKALRRLPISSNRMAMMKRVANSEWRVVADQLFAIRHSLFAASAICYSPQPFRGVERRDDDVLIAGAAAEIARNRNPDLLLGRVRIVAQEL